MKDDQASSTAYTVLQGILYVAQSTPYAYLVDEEVVKVGKQILQGSEEGRNRLQQLNGTAFRWGVKLREAIMLPGITLHYILRKNHVESITRQAIEQGITQVIMLGAGFDTLPWRLHKAHNDINFIEIDHPATQKAKLGALDKNHEKGDNLHFLSVDFAKQTLKTALSEFDKFDPSRKTLFICEGVMMYLSPKDVDILLDSVKELTGPGTEFVFSALEPQGTAKNTIPKLLYFYLKMINEPITWDLESKDMANFLQQRHFELLGLAGRDELLSAYVKDSQNVKLHSGEYFCHCRFSG